jgi:hypothetical protein
MASAPRHVSRNHNPNLIEPLQMNPQDLSFLLSLSISFACIIGVIRFNNIDKSYYPFLYDIWLALLVEIVVFLLAKQKAYGVLNGVVNIFSIVDCLLFTWLFYRWNLFKRNSRLLYLLVAFFILAWIIFSFFVHGFAANNWYFRLIYSFGLIFFGVTYFNKLVVGERGNMLHNSKFLICLGLIIFYTFFTVICATQLSIFQNEFSRDFRRSLQQINIFSNVFVNLIYALAVLWIPRKKAFTTAY